MYRVVISKTFKARQGLRSPPVRAAEGLASFVPDDGFKVTLSVFMTSILVVEDGFVYYAAYDDIGYAASYRVSVPGNKYFDLPRKPSYYDCMLFDLLLFVVGLVAGGIAAVVGFGVGSFLTPVLALRTGFGVAVAAVGIAHLFGSALRFWLLRHDIDRRTLITFGALSAVGGLLGALLQNKAASTVLAIVFGSLMVWAGISGLLRWNERIATKGAWAWIIGAVSGFFGGVVGNLGGLRAVGLLGFDLKKTAFVATATAVALIVDVFRLPVYVATHYHELTGLTLEIMAMALGVALGTVVGAPLLRRLPDRVFRIALSCIIIVVGILV